MSAWLVAASGPSLTPEVASQCAGLNTLVVNDAWRLFPNADVLYACDSKWWDLPHGRADGPPRANEFSGQRWTSLSLQHNKENAACAERHGLKLIEGRDLEGFCFEPNVIHFGANSGFQGINLAMNQFGATHIVLVGFDMRSVGGMHHFFGGHSHPLLDPDPLFFRLATRDFNNAAKMLPSHIKIVNATPGSALDCFPSLLLEDALNEIRSLSA